MTKKTLLMFLAVSVFVSSFPLPVSAQGSRGRSLAGNVSSSSTLSDAPLLTTESEALPAVPVLFEDDATHEESGEETGERGEMGEIFEHPHARAEQAAPLDQAEASLQSVTIATPSDMDQVIISGPLGDNLTWTLYVGGTLVISGTGDMYNYHPNYGYPWWGRHGYIDYRDSITSVIIDNGVTSIGCYAFQHLSNLTSVTIAEGVASISEGAFTMCDSLTHVALPDSLISIGYDAFHSCPSLTHITLPENLISIGLGAFASCGLESIIIPDSVTSLGEYDYFGGLEGTFFDCNSLISAVIGKGVKSIPYGAFWGSGFKHITIPDNVIIIGDSAFSGCDSLESINIPDSVTSIGEAAFCDCSSLKGITIPDSVTSIGEAAFCGCSSLKSITIPDSVTSIGDHTFDNCSSLESVTIPDNVTSIGDLAFYNCSSLESVTIPDNVTSIGDYAFLSCSSLQSVIIPRSVSSIGDGAFDWLMGDFQIYCFGGSYAEKYAQQKGLNYTILFDEQLLYAESVTTSKASGMSVGDVFLLRVSFGLNPSLRKEAELLRVSLPEGIFPVTEEVSLNGKTRSLTTEEDGTVVFDIAGMQTVTAYLYCTATEPGMHTVRATADICQNGGQPETVNVGEVSFLVDKALLNLPKVTGTPSFTVTGKTLPDARVDIYDNDNEEPVGTLTANAVGSFAGEVELAEPLYSYSYHFIHAVISGGGLPEGETIVSDDKLVIYEDDLADVQLSTITMYNDGGLDRIVFDFQSDSTVTPYYNLTTDRYSASFQVEFTGQGTDRLSDVYVITENSGGVKTYVPMAYNAEKDVWIGSHNYTSFNDAPVRVSASYSLLDSSLNYPHDEQMVEDWTNILADELEDVASAFTELSTVALNEDDERTRYDEESNTLFLVMSTEDPDHPGQRINTSILSIQAEEIDVSGFTSETLLQDGFFDESEDEGTHELWVKSIIEDECYTSITIDLTSGMRYIEKIELLNEQAAQLMDNTYVEKGLLETLLGYIPIVGDYWNVGIDAAYGFTNVYIIGQYINGNLAVLNDSIDFLQDYLDKGCPCGTRCKCEDCPMTEKVDDFQRRLLKIKKETSQYKVNGEYEIVRQIFETLVTLAGDVVMLKAGKDLDKLYKANRGPLPRGRSISKYIELLEQRSASRKYVKEAKKVLFRLNITKDVLDSFVPEAVTFDIAKEYQKINDEIDALREEMAQALIYCRQQKEKSENDPGGNDGSSAMDDLGNLATNPSLQQSSVSKPVSYIIDPSGYVYEAVPSNRIEGVTAVITSEADDGTPWNAADYDQINPQITGTDGGYYWDVPPGNWKVSLSKDGYEPADTAMHPNSVDGWLPVPPPQMEINVPMVSTAAPTVQMLLPYEDRIELVFSQYMNIESVQGAVELSWENNLVAAEIAPLDAEGTMEPVERDESGSVDPNGAEDAADGQGNGQNGGIAPVEAEDTPDGAVQFAKRFSIVPAEGDMSGDLAVSVKTDALNYAGTPLETAYFSDSFVVIPRPEELKAPETLNLIFQEPGILDIQLEPAIDNYALTVENLSPAILSVETTTIKTDVAGKATLEVTGNMPGNAKLRVFDAASGLDKAIDVRISLKTFSVSYNANGGDGDMPSGKATQGRAYMLPACSFQEPEGMHFKAWKIGEFIVRAGESYVFTEDTTVEAVWENVMSVIWLNGDGSRLDSQTYYEGQTEPTTDKTPTKEDDSGSVYVFCNSWEQSSSGNTKTYIPRFAKIAFDSSETNAPGIGILKNLESAAKTVVLYTSDSSARIYYTLDGSMPDPAEKTTMLYEQPFELERTTVVKAISIKGNISSAVSLMKVFVQTQEELENVKSLLVGEAVFSNADGEIVEGLGNIGADRRVIVSLNADFASEQTDIAVIKILLATYDAQGQIVGLQSKDIEVWDSGITFIGIFDLPNGKEIGSVRLFTVSDKMIPLLNANLIQ